MNDNVFMTIMLGMIVLGGLAFLALVMRSRDRMRALAIQERIAMIEKGLIPAPEADPARFERLAGLRRPASVASVRHRTAGIVMIGMGIAFMVLIGSTAAPSVGFGVGGGFAVLGAAFLVNGLLLARDNDHHAADFRMPGPHTVSAPPVEPPTNIAP